MHVLTATLVKSTYKRQFEELGVQDKIEYDLNAFQIDLDAPKSTKQTNAVLSM